MNYLNISTYVAVGVRHVFDEKMDCLFVFRDI